MEEAILGVLSKARQLLASITGSASSSSSLDPRCCVKEDLKQLTTLLPRIKAAIRDAEEMEVRDASVKLRLTELEDVAYDAEDVLDEYHYEVLRAQVEGRAAAEEASRKRKFMEKGEEVCGSTSSSSPLTSIPDGMANRIGEIRRLYDEISNDREALRWREEDGERRAHVTYPPPTGHLVDESTVYGREQQRQELIDLLLSENKENTLSVIPIVGIVGIGKTTLAQLVYNHPSVKQYFNLKAWVYVSVDFDVVRITKAIIESITGQSCRFTQLSLLQKILTEQLTGKKVLLVLDDVWNEERCSWEMLQGPFLASGAVSIIVTTRNLPVAEIMQTVQNPYSPGYLLEDSCWLLFQSYAFRDRDPDEYSVLVEIGKQIVRRCSGLPLAVKTLGGLLHLVSDEDSWNNILQSDLWQLLDDPDNKILAALRLSYDWMPAYLKPCFLYLSMYPKDIQYDEDDVVWLWIANGYIQAKDRVRMEDVGKGYFEALLKRSILEAQPSRGRNTYYLMHNMIHYLARSISRKRCLSISVGEKLCDSAEKVQHLYIGVEDYEEIANSLCHNHTVLRTLLATKESHKMYSLSMLQWTSRLRALYLTCCLDELPDSIGHLKHLRYLYIFSRTLRRLPGSICLLYNLQILRLETLELKELPRNVGNLINLYYMNVNGKYDRLPESICRLENLHTLHCCDLPIRELSVIIGDLKNLRLLSKLHIEHCSQLTSVVGLHELDSLEELTIINCHELCVLRKMPPKLQAVSIVCCWKLTSLGGLQGLTSNIRLKLQRCPKLQLNPNECLQPVPDKVEIVDCPRFNTHQFKNIQKISAQESLKLSLISDIPSEPEVENPPSLKHLCIRGARGPLPTVTTVWLPSTLVTLRFFCCDLEGSLSLHQNLSVLKKLQIDSCQHLVSVVGLSKLHALEVLEIGNCPLIQLPQEEPLPPKLRALRINRSWELTSLAGLQELTSLRSLYLNECPKLWLHPDECLRSTLNNVDIFDCPRLTEWCKTQEFVYGKDYF